MSLLHNSQIRILRKNHPLSLRIPLMSQIRNGHPDVDEAEVEDEVEDEAEDEADLLL